MDKNRELSLVAIGTIVVWAAWNEFDISSAVVGALAGLAIFVPLLPGVVFSGYVAIRYPDALRARVANFTVMKIVQSTILGAGVFAGVLLLLSRAGALQLQLNTGVTLEATLRLLSFYCLAAVAEELVFRAGLLWDLPNLSPSTAVLVQAGLFAAFHLPTIGGFAALFLSGLIYGLVVLSTESVWPAIFVHVLYNSAQLLGLSQSTAALLSIAVYDPTAIAIIEIANVLVLVAAAAPFFLNR